MKAADSETMSWSTVVKGLEAKRDVPAADMSTKAASAVAGAAAAVASAATPAVDDPLTANPFKRWSQRLDGDAPAASSAATEAPTEAGAPKGLDDFMKKWGPAA